MCIFVVRGCSADAMVVAWGVVVKNMSRNFVV